jgi:hypothetical protein
VSYNAAVFEVRIETKSDKPIRWHSWKDGVEYAKNRVMLHIERRSQKQATREASKYGKVLSCRQVSKADMLEREAIRIDSLPLDNKLYMNVNQYSNAIAIDEFTWKKRNLRRKNTVKDKNNY